MGSEAPAGGSPDAPLLPVHTDAELADQDSDHDPQVVRLPPRGR